MKRPILILLQIFAGLFLWFGMLILWTHWLPFYTEYASDYSRVEAKGKSIALILFVIAQYFAYRRRVISNSRIFQT